MKKLHISSKFSLPLDAVTQTFAILAKRGVGKTYTARVMAEEMLENKQQIIAIDPTGAWWGLRSKYPIVVLGGEHGDLPLEEGAGEVIANAIVENGFSAIIDLSLFRKGQMIRFMVDFAETLYRINRAAVHIFIDEADAVAPQAKNYGGEENRMLGAMEDIVRRGRKRGIGCTLITQRPAVLNKNVLTQCEVLVAMRLVHPKDIDAIEEWVNVHGDPQQAKKMIAGLPALPIGTAWFWSPGWGEFFEQVAIRAAQTFDSGATPKAGERIKQPKEMAKIDIKMLGEKINSTLVHIKANNPRELKKIIAELEKKLAAAPPAKIVEEQIKLVPVLQPHEIGRIEGALLKAENLIPELKHFANVLKDAMDQLRKPSMYQHQKPRVEIANLSEKTSKNIPAFNSPVTSSEEMVMTGGLRRIMIALAQCDGLSIRQVAVRAGMSGRSGTFNTYISKAKTSGWIEGDRNRMMITGRGRTAVGSYNPLPEGKELLTYWVNELGNSGASKILQVLAHKYPLSMTKQDIGHQVGMSHTSGTFNTYVSKLKTLDLIKGSTELTASEEFFV